MLAKNPNSLVSFIAWAEKQPPRKRYTFMDCEGGCLIGQYLASEGITWREGVYTKFSNENNWCADVVADYPHTFGAALKRALALV